MEKNYTISNKVRLSIAISVFVCEDDFKNEDSLKKFVCTKDNLHIHGIHMALDVFHFAVFCYDIREWGRGGEVIDFVCKFSTLNKDSYFPISCIIPFFAILK